MTPYWCPSCGVKIRGDQVIDSDKGERHDYCRQLVERILALKNFWWCPECKEEVPWSHVTYEGHHERCGSKVQALDDDDRPLTEQIAALQAELTKETQCTESYRAVIEGLKDDVRCRDVEIDRLKAENQRLRAGLRNIELELPYFDYGLPSIFTRIGSIIGELLKEEK